MYGFSKMYALTGLDEFLEVAQRNAAYWLENLPADRVPYWDFQADRARRRSRWARKRTSSAAAIAASGLLDLARQTGSSEWGVACHNQALVTLDALAGPEYSCRPDARLGRDPQARGLSHPQGPGRGRVGGLGRLLLRRGVD